MRRRRGGAAVELAMLMPVVVLYLGVFLESVWIYWTHTAMLTVVEHGCRQGASGLDTALVSDAVDAAAAQNGLDCPSEDCVVEAVMTEVSDVPLMQCDLTYEYSGLTELLPIEVQLTARSLALVSS